ncbi:MAG TPA: WHG domain-containing protein [Micromonosporaceae bacterium]
MATSTHGRYHHGDLANALSAAALELARSGGPEAVVLREAARQVGVSATAAYRHFDNHDALMESVKLECQVELVGRMENELLAGDPQKDPQLEAVRRLYALGRAYISFARTEPGLFRTAFCRSTHPKDEQWAQMLEAPGFLALLRTLDDMVDTGLLAPERRPGAELVAWSGVHGLSVLILDGPLGALPNQVIEQLIARVQEGILTGILGRAVELD